MTNHQVLFKSQQNWLKQGVEKFTVRSINLLVLFGIRRNCPRSGRSQSLLPVYEKGDKTYCTSNYRFISILPTAYKILSSILLSRLTPCAQEIIGDRQYGFQCNRSTTEHVFYICQTLEKKWEFIGAVHQLFIDFKRALIQLGINSCIIFSLSLVSYETGKTTQTVSE